MTSQEPYKLEITLSSVEHQLAIDFQNTLETILNKPISLENSFKIAMFHTLHINNIKLKILENYEFNNTHKSTNNHISKKNTNKSRKRRKIPYKQENNQQVTLLEGYSK
jgi:hypothetical protein